MVGVSISAIIAAAGNGSRMGTDKMLMPLLGEPVIVRTVRAFTDIEQIDEIIVVSSEQNAAEFKRLLSAEFPSLNLSVIIGGQTRSESSICGIKAAKGDYVLIHDGARPLVSRKSILECIDAAFTYGAAALGVVPKDTVKRTENGIITQTVERDSTVLIQTPQIFSTAEILAAYSKYSDFSFTDDCGAAEKAGIKIHVTDGDYENIKLTTQEDILIAEQVLKKRGERSAGQMRVGTGFDTHRLVENRPLIIGGVKIPHSKGLLGHSDADVLIHAVIDALFGSCALGNIGSHFPDTDEKYFGISSMLLLRETGRIIKSAGYCISNIDATLIIQQPKMAAYIEQMVDNISSALEISPQCVSVKAKTNEKMGFTGREDGVEARAVVLVYR